MLGGGYLSCLEAMQSRNCAGQEMRSIFTGSGEPTLLSCCSDVPDLRFSDLSKALHTVENAKSRADRTFKTVLDR